jgi:hypothetical protein
MIEIQPSHVAILVPSVRKAADYLQQFGFEIGKEEIWDGEGTKEIYVERDKGNSLLLMEPIKTGAYQRALEKRGPGLHHLAINVLNLESYLDSISGSGWLLHPKSIKSVKEFQTAYLARPGFSGLIEVQQRDALEDRPFFVDGVSLEMDPSAVKLIKSIGLDMIVKPSISSELSLEGKVVPLRELF